MSLCFTCEDGFEEHGGRPELTCASCHRCFHYECADGPGAAPPAPSEAAAAYHCPDCLAGVHRCGTCCKYAGEDDEKNGIVRCCAPRCGVWYHHRASSDVGAGRKNKTKKGGSKAFPCLPGFCGTAKDVRRYVCPRHACNGCGAGTGAATGTGAAALRRCLRCPATFCDACRPRDVHVLSALHVVCMRHGGAGLPPPPAALSRVSHFGRPWAAEVASGLVPPAALAGSPGYLRSPP